MAASLLNSASEWKKEGEKGEVCVLRDCPNGDECYVNASVVIMSLSGQEETLRKDDKDLGMVKLRE